MQRKIKTNRFLALLMSLMMLATLLPAAAFTESGMTEYPEAVMEPNIDGETPPDVPDDPVIDNDGETDISEQTEQMPAWDEPLDDWMEDAPADETDIEAPLKETLESIIADYGYAYVMTTHAATVYGASDMAEPVFTIAHDSVVLLAIEYRTQDGTSSVKVCFLTEGSEMIVGYVEANTIADTILWDEDVDAMASVLWSELMCTDFGELYVFVIQGEKSGTTNDDPAEEVIPGEPVDGTVYEPTEEPVPDAPSAAAGDYVAVSPKTRVFLRIDETASDAYIGDLSLGVFVNDATVQVTVIDQDSLGRYWFKVRFIYGDDFADGTLKWTDEDFIYVLAAETADTMEQECSVTDYAFSSAPAQIAMFSTPMNGFSLKSINGSIPSLSVGQTGVHGSSGKDSDYKQIATAPGHGTVYATPHYLNGFTVYCLEHNLPGPGENISGGGQQPTGPYVIREIETLDGFIRTDETIQVVIAESYVVPEGKEMFHLINYLGIQTGFEITMTPVMWAGVALVLAAAALAAVHGVQSKKKRHRRRCR